MVRLLDAVDAVALGLEAVAVERELVESAAGHGARQLGSEAIGRNHLVLVVVLQDTADSPQSLQVLVPRRIPIVQRVMLILRAIGRGEVNGHMKVNLAAAENVLEEAHDGLELEFLDRDQLTLDV